MSSENINYQKELDEILEQIGRLSVKPSLLLHSCCGPCSSYVLSYLRVYFDITVLYYNPNIYPEDEYYKRLKEQKKIINCLDDVNEIKLVDIPYNHSEFLSEIHGLESEPEGGKRCTKCFNLRIQKTAELAQKGKYDYFCTTLTVSPHKNHILINKIGEVTANGLAVTKWLPSDFKKKNGYKISVDLSKKYDLYRQDYCGCEFAKQ